MCSIEIKTKLPLFIMILICFNIGLVGTQVSFILQGQNEEFVAPSDLFVPLKFEISASGEVLLLHGRQGQQAMHYRSSDGKWQKILGQGVGPGEAVFSLSFVWQKKAKEIYLQAFEPRKVILFKQDQPDKWKIKKEWKISSYYYGLRLFSGESGNWLMAGFATARSIISKDQDSIYSLFELDDKFEFKQGLLKQKEFYSDLLPGIKDRSNEWLDRKNLFAGGFLGFSSGSKVYQIWSWSPRLLWYDLNTGEQGHFYLNGPNYKWIEYTGTMVREQKVDSREFNRKYQPEFFNKFSSNFILNGFDDKILLIHSVSNEGFSKTLEAVIAGHDGKILGSGLFNPAAYEIGLFHFDGERRLLYHLYEDLEKEGRWLLQTYRLSWPGMTKN